MIYPVLEGVKYVCTDYLEEALSYTVIKLSYLSDSELTPYVNGGLMNRGGIESYMMIFYRHFNRNIIQYARVNLRSGPLQIF